MSIKELYRTLLSIKGNAKKQAKELQDIKLLIAKDLCARAANAKTMKEAEFKVFSQWGDDGIIQYLIHHVEIENKVFIEFGVENYLESNTRFLLMNDNWTGLVMDGSEENVRYIKNDEISWRYNLTAKQAFITAENINEMIGKENIRGNIGILHIDIDGNDYWVWRSIKCVDPDIVIVEYNSSFGSERSITIPYSPDFTRTKAHYSNLYYGASLSSLCDLADEKDYYFVGCNSAGNNAYFIKKNKIGKLKPLTCKEGFIEAQFRESRGTGGDLTFLSGSKRQEILKGLKVMNTRTERIEFI